MSRIYTVRELTESVKRTLEGTYPFVWVRGQVTNLTRAGSGHMYFSLRDADALLGCVWFRGNQRGEESFDPLTGEVYEEGPRPGLAQTMREGMEMMCAGRLNVYPPRGSYQLVVEVAQEAGLGRLFLEFEALKRSLAEKGYFDAQRKRPLPYHPARVAVVTAPTGAAIRDFLRIAGERGWGASIRVYPALVQGDAAPEQVARAIQQVNEHGWADVIALIRGGGSLEDLWTFNDERVASAIFSSRVPVISGVGHEVDVTIADLVADVRAATPTHAAQMLWPERAVLAQSVDELQMRLVRRWESTMREREATVAALGRGLAWLSPAERLRRLDERLAEFTGRLERGVQGVFVRADGRVQAVAARLKAAFGPQVAEQGQARVDALGERLHRAAAMKIFKGEQVFERLAVQLAALDPMRPLERGYSLVRKRDGTFLRSVEEVLPGDGVTIAVRDGVVQADVTGLARREKGKE